jgi:hypothetical protein
MALNELIRGLKDTEQQLLKQLKGVRSAISSLSFGSAVSPAMPGPAVRKRRKLSAKARAAISRAQKLRWAKQRAEKK